MKTNIVNIGEKKVKMFSLNDFFYEETGNAYFICMHMALFVCVFVNIYMYIYTHTYVYIMYICVCL